MLGKGAVSVLIHLITDLPNEPDLGYQIDDIVRLADMRYWDSFRAVEYLVSEGFLSQKEDMVGPRGNKYSVTLYRLTEKGKYYKLVRRQEILDYIKYKWEDVFASLIALVALIVSVVALCK